MIDDDGFHYKYVPKEQIQISNDEIRSIGKKIVSKRKGSNVDALSTKAMSTTGRSQKSKNKTYIYVQKSSITNAANANGADQTNA